MPIRHSVVRYGLVVLCCLQFLFIVSESPVAAKALETQPESTLAGWIAFTGADGNIWLIRPDGSDSRQITADGSSDFPYRNPKWSSDGKQLIFDGTDWMTGDTRVFLFRDGQVNPVPNVWGCRYPAFAPGDQSFVANCRGDGSTPSEEEFAWNPAYAFLSSSDLNGENWQILVPYITMDSDKPGIQWEFGHITVIQLDVSPVDGAIAIFATGSLGPRLMMFDGEGNRRDDTCQEWLCDTAGINATFAQGLDGETLTARVCFGDWRCWQDFSIEFWSIGLDGLPIELITKLPPMIGASAPSLSPNGQAIVFGAGTTPDDAGLYIAQIGGEPVLIPQNIGLFQGTNPAWQSVAVHI